jgi:hypothetical protein
MKSYLNCYRHDESWKQWAYNNLIYYVRGKNLTNKFFSPFLSAGDIRTFPFWILMHQHISTCYMIDNLQTAKIFQLGISGLHIEYYEYSISVLFQNLPTILIFKLLQSGREESKVCFDQCSAKCTKWFLWKHFISGDDWLHWFKWFHLRAGSVQLSFCCSILMCSMWAFKFSPWTAAFEGLTCTRHCLPSHVPSRPIKHIQ